MSSRSYTCLESQTTISPPSARATSKAARLLPTPVGPRKTGTWTVCSNRPVRPASPSIVAAEVALQILPIEDQAGRTSVRAGDGVLGLLQLLEEPALLGRVQPVAEADGRVAGEGRRRLLEQVLRPGIQHDREQLPHRLRDASR